MGVLLRFERRVSRTLEGGFARVFRSRVEPVELAVALKRECDDKKSIGPAQTLVPNDFVVDLGPADYDRLAPYILTLGDELAEMVREHGSEQRYTFLGPVDVTFHRSTELGTGSYRVGSRVEAGDDVLAMPSPARRVAATAAPSSPAPPVPATVPGPAVPPRPRVDDAQRTQALHRPAATFGTFELPDGSRTTVTGGEATIGRGQGCEIHLADASVSRQHARVTVDDGRVTVEDLASTNGMTVNGERVARAVLADGDRIALGAATLTYRT